MFIIYYKQSAASREWYCLKFLETRVLVLIAKNYTQYLILTDIQGAPDQLLTIDFGHIVRVNTLP